MKMIMVIVVVGGDCGDDDDDNNNIVIMVVIIISIGYTWLLLAQNCPATWGSALPVFGLPKGHFIWITVTGKVCEFVWSGLNWPRKYAGMGICENGKESTGFLKLGKLFPG